MKRPTGDERNAAEIEYWNGPGGERWLNRQQAQDALLAPVADVLLDRAAAHPGEIVLDIGCGCGSTSIALAQRVAPGGHVLGIAVLSQGLGHGIRRRRRCLSASSSPTRPFIASSPGGPICSSRDSG